MLKSAPILGIGICLIVATSACSPSWPKLTGRETLPQFHAAVTGSMQVNGTTFRDADIDCRNQDSDVACEWLSAFWQADAADAAARCERGEPLENDDKGRVRGSSCDMAACYALGLNTFRYGDSEATDARKSDEKEDVVPSCHSRAWAGKIIGGPDLAIGISESRLKPPPISVEKALGFLAKGCEAGSATKDHDRRHDAAHDCETLARALTDGILGGIVIRQDFELAHSIWARGESLDDDNSGLTPQQIDSQWPDFLHGRTTESEGDRAARIARVQAGYAKWAQHNSKLVAAYDDLNDPRGYLQAAAAGLSAGGATVVASSPGSNVNPSRPGAKSATPTPPLPSLMPAATGPVCVIATPSQAGQARVCACFASQAAEKAQELGGTSYATVGSCGGSGLPCCCAQPGSAMLCQCSPQVPGATCQQICQNTRGTATATCGP